MNSVEELEAAFKKAVKNLEGEKRAAIKKAKGTKGKKAKDAIADVDEEYDAKLKELQTNHEIQLARLREVIDDSIRITSQDVTEDDEFNESMKERRLEKCRRKKERQKEREAQRQKEIEDEQANAGPSLRDVELEQIKSVLTPLNMTIVEVKADGNCLYRAVGAQINRDFLDVRK
jgi:OTU domain-containing protein 6